MRQPLGQLIISGILMTALSSTAKAEAYGSGWYGEIQASYGHEDNISRTYKSDQVSDEIATFSLGGGYSTKLQHNSQLILSSYVTVTQHKEYDVLDNVAVSVGFDYTIQPNTTYAGVWYKVKFDATDFTYSDNREREGLVLATDVSANKRLTTTLTGHLGLRYKDMLFVGKSNAEKRNDEAFDFDFMEAYIGLDYQLTEKVFLFGEYGYRRGDIISTVSAGAANTVYDAETIDDVYDPPCTRRCPTSYAYRADGDTHLATLGIAFPIGTVNIDLTASYFDSDSEIDRQYQDWVVKLGFLWNF